MLHAILTSIKTEPLKASTKLNYLGVEGHWKVYNFEGKYEQFVYLSAQPQLVFNCLYEI